MGSLNVEDHGEWLSFGLSHAGATIPARISREVMEEFFGAVPEPDSLKKNYARDAEMIHARAADLIVRVRATRPTIP
jgi:hypothetical protein